jgi:hypothetical protein
LLIFTYFCHRHLLAPTCFCHHRLHTFPCSRMFSPLPFFRYFAYFRLLCHTLACLFVSLFELRTCPPYLVFPPLFVCARNGT